MKVFSFAPLPVGVLPWNDPEPCVTVIVKWTLSFGRSGFTGALAQEPLCHRIPSLFGNPAELHHPGDFAPRKGRCDVLLTGSAYAAAPASSIDVRLRVGPLHKQLFALAGEPTTAIPLSVSYLRRQRRFDAEMVFAGALAQGHPERARLASSAPPGPAALSQAALPRSFDYRYFNAAPADQQVDVLGPGTLVSLTGLSPDGAPITGALPEKWPQVFAASTESARLEEIELRCDTLWIDTDRSVCELTLRGAWRPRERRARGGRGDASMPAALAVTLRDPAERSRPVTVADLPGAVISRALFPAEVAEIEDDASPYEEISEVEEIEAEPLDVEDSDAFDDARTGAIPAARPAAAPSPEASAPAPRMALGRLGAMQLLSERPPEMPALPPDPRAAGAAEGHVQTEEMDAFRPFRPNTLPFVERRNDASPAPPPMAPPGLAPAARKAGDTVPPLAGPRRPRTLDLSPADTPAPAPALPFGAAKDAPPAAPALPFAPAKDAPPVAPALPFAPAKDAPPAPGRVAPTFGFNAAPLGPRRPRTLDLPASAADRPALPFANAAAPGPRVEGPTDPGSARARFAALTSAAPVPPPPPVEVSSMTGPSPAPPPLVITPPAAALIEPPPPVAAPPMIAAPPAPLMALGASSPLTALGASPPIVAPPPVVTPAPAPIPPPPPAPIPPPFSAPVAPPPAPSDPAALDRRRTAPPPSSPGSEPSSGARTGLLPLSVDAAIQQEIFRGEAPLREILARHGIDEARWNDHLARREAVRAEAAKSKAPKPAPEPAPADKKKAGRRPLRPAGTGKKV